MAEIFEDIYVKFMSLDSNHPEMYTRAYQYVRAVYALIGGTNSARIIADVDKDYYSLPKLDMNVSDVEKLIWIKTQTNPFCTMNLNGHAYSVFEINQHLQRFYEKCLLYMTAAYMKQDDSYGIDLDYVKYVPYKKVKS